MLQRQIINTVCEYVKPGGTLMYSTCTLRKAENENQLEYIISKHPQFKVDSAETLFPDGEHDGFFIARLVKKA